MSRGLTIRCLIPSAGDARPGWTLDDFKRAVSQARGGKIAVIQLHGVPDTAHSWVNTPTPLFESYVKYLADNGYRVIALRDLARYVDPTVVPSNPWGVIDDRKGLLSSGRDGSNARRAGSDAELRGWLTSMLVHHHFSPTEAGAALGLTADEVGAAAKRLGIPTDGEKEPRPTVLPYPGGRHPRIGFLDGAIRCPPGETKVRSSFCGRAVRRGGCSRGGLADIAGDGPEQVWHSFSPYGPHVPSFWRRATWLGMLPVVIGYGFLKLDGFALSLPAIAALIASEWTARIEVSRTLPNKIGADLAGLIPRARARRADVAS